MEHLGEMDVCEISRCQVAEYLRNFSFGSDCIEVL
jgi:hypothetical protein